MNALLKLSLSSLALASLVSCGGGAGGKPVDEDAALRVVADAAQAASASSTPPVEAASDPSLPLIEQAARAGQGLDTMAAAPASGQVGSGGSAAAVAVIDAAAAPGAGGSSAMGAPAAAPSAQPGLSPGAGGALAGASPGTSQGTGQGAASTSTAAVPSTSTSNPSATATTSAGPGTSSVASTATTVPATAPAQPAPSTGTANESLTFTTRTNAPATPGVIAGQPARPAVKPVPGGTRGAEPTPSLPEPPLADCGLGDSAEQIVRRINEIRARGASCGARGEFAPAAALAWNTRLYAAASGHSTDMAVNNYFAHLNPAGQGARDRVVDVGYAYRLVAENIAAGQPSLDKVLAAWLASEGHCANLMQPAVRDVALACASEQGATYPTYWTLNVAAAR